MSKSYISPSLRRTVGDRANDCCEHCLIPEALSLSSHHVAHIIAEKHGGHSTLENLALACALCNLAKGSDIASIDPHTGETVRLYNPRKDIWTDHFTLESVSGLIQPKTAIGRVTANLLRINRLENLTVRQLLAKIG
ncbi:HNH endonuclease [Synechocystis salina]|uniref:HNH endonuclease n=1 Tax=Synechocystis salina LEGE 00031 TaxID=1828736 RepID=A0ABR9VMG0_9SYNC|nr:HNH endonuclease signature motif containing protein [Synechocystis salina]MBE9239782.1 HNH endonuclease [Synechocystis salina LEGE 00041]MBE9252517.1 HNH endonuclease [Synechocystis salina LEGE 00031]